MQEKVKKLVEAYEEQVQRHYRWLHAHPELSGVEKRSAAYVASVLREMGLTPTEGVGGYGVVALIEGRSGGKCVGLRADLDALPIHEITGLPYTSENAGVMHACGHDAHTAMLLGTAYVLNALRDQFDGCIKLIFQPSEEDNINSGARKMIAAGVLENPKVDAMLGQHVWPLGKLGSVYVRNGTMMAASDRFYIRIHGKKSHGSAPENGIDAIVIGAEVISMLQTIVSRNVGPFESAVITIGEIRGGSRYNVIADNVEMVGTCRTLTKDVREFIPQHIESIIHGVTESMGGTYEFKYIKCYSPTVNDTEMSRMVQTTVKKTLGENALVVPEHAALTAEDFSFYCENVPSCYFWLGCQKEGAPFYPLHNERFSPAPETLSNGIKVMANAALAYLTQKSS